MSKESTKSKTKIIYEGNVKELILKPYYDLHGDILWMREETEDFKDVNIKLQKRKFMSKLLGREITRIELFINGKEHNTMEITSIHGTPERLEIRGCSGAG